jgi:hypothetical protein
MLVPDSSEQCLLLCLGDSFNDEPGSPFCGFSCLGLVTRKLDLTEIIHGTYHLSLFSQSLISGSHTLGLFLLEGLFSGLLLLLSKLSDHLRI